MMAMKIIEAIANCFYVYSIMIVIWCLLSWLPMVNYENPIIKALDTSVRLYVDIFRKFIPPIAGMFDLSPVVAMIVLIFLRNAIIYVTYFIFSVLGMV